MVAYSYDNDGIYAGEVERQFDALDNVWLMPAGATDKKPFEQEGYVSNWTGDSWLLVKDNSGIWYSTETKAQVILKPLDNPDGYTKLVPPQGFYIWGGKSWVVDDKAKKDDDNKKIISKLLLIDSKRIRPISEISNPDLDAKVKAAALKNLAELESQAQQLRKQIQE